MIIETSSGRSYKVTVKIQDMSKKTLFPGELSNLEYCELLASIERLMHELQQPYQKFREDCIC